MQVLRTISVAAMVAMLGAAGAQAQSLRNADEPAEFPPASFKGSQYVDSRGCIYVRAGQGGAVQWIPRVSRTRKVLCGFKPSLAQAEQKLPVIPDPVAPEEPTTVVAATPVAPKPAPQQAVAEKPAAVAAASAAATAKPRPNPFAIDYTPVEAAPKPSRLVAKAPAQPAPKPISSYAGKTVGERGCVADASGGVNCAGGQSYVLKRVPAGVTIRTANGETLTTDTPTLVRVAVKSAPAPAPVAVPTPVPAAAQSIEYTPYAATAPQYAAALDCAALGAATAAYMRSSRGFDVRCGPQAEHPSAYARSGYAPAQVARVSTKMNYAIPHPQKIHVPKGYRPAWSDGRINPYRGAPSYAGDQQQGMLWTQTSPAYGVHYPHRKTFWEWLFGPSVTSKKTTTVRTASQSRDARPAAPATTRVSLKAAAPSKTPVAVQNKVTQPAQAAKTAPKAAPAGLRYVQVGTFGVPENAQRSISRLSAMGLPVSSQKLTRNGRSYKIVLAGPFAQPEHTMSALGKVRAAGYGDAFARK